MLQPMSQELRRHRRLRVHARADVLGDEVVLGAPLSDLSMGGCGLEGPVFAEPGARVGLLLDVIGQDRRIALLAEVVRAGEGGAGLRFVDVTEAQRKELRRCIHGARAAS